MNTGDIMIRRIRLNTTNVKYEHGRYYDTTNAIKITPEKYEIRFLFTASQLFGHSSVISKFASPKPWTFFDLLNL